MRLLTFKITARFTQKVLFFAINLVFGCRDPELASTLLKKQFLTKEEDFPEDLVPKCTIDVFTLEHAHTL